MSYMSDFVNWTERRASDGDIIARMAADPFFKRFFIDKMKAMKSAAEGSGK